MAPTMPASRVQIICRCNTLDHEHVPDKPARKTSAPANTRPHAVSWPHMKR